ncbi:tripartite tricarboxylate transporter substrate binding protein [Reyranella sp. MMS21-HV4-11]|uniref:Tripartite tricarboxylate transporter substrate binding protein n=1 Tax=Reyranella humidisoli TaxID=2849149 RepID=A0ABS6IR88_9HYPH|nr:tripartite tricarboxylate transporter substrate binding protein [Reyranella sp. MMS21-HV4-11]MBU8877106.1 tripartite tricarboxylate transporter substrate binding protein [Reyranella sp. MMS21-HV4-11]
MTFTRRGALAALAAMALATPAAAQTYPDKPIRMIIAFAAGGPTDVVGRLLAPRLSEILGQQVIVENKPGATGNIGTAMVADAKPDGYTILFSASTMAMAPALYGKSLGYDPVNGLAAIAYVASAPLILLAPMDGAKSTPELVGMLRKDPGKYSYASSGNGGMIHLASYLFATRAGGDALHVPYRGSAPGMVDMIAGRHGFQIDTLQSSKGFIDGGKVRVLGVASQKRLPQLPDVPTIQEATGFDYAINTWYAAYAPAKTPRPIIDRLNAAFNQALKQPDMVKKANELALELVDSTPEQAKKFYDDQMAFWDPIIKQSGAKPE